MTIRAGCGVYFGSAAQRHPVSRDAFRRHPAHTLRVWRAVAWLTVAALIGAAPLRAQVNGGEIAGVVRDAQGAVLPGVSVVAVHLETGASIERVTDGSGHYLVAGLPVGSYSISASLPGFARLVRPQLTIELGQRLQLDLVLQVGAMFEELTVTTEAPLLQASTAEISAVIGREAVADVPLNGRNFLALAQLSDAVVLPPGGTRGDALQQAGPLPNVGGQRSGHNIYLLDGVKVTDELFNNLVINPSVDAIQEFKIQKSQYAAEFGGKASALINVATRSGTSVLRGSLFGFGRHERLDSRGFFDPAEAAKPLTRQHQVGGTAGGPLRPHRSFFFASYEGQRARRGLVRTFSVPSADARAGRLGALQLDPHAFDPASLALLERVPLPNRTGEFQNLVAVGDQTRRADQIGVRVDQRIGATHQMLARVSTFDVVENQPFGTSVLQETLLPGFGRRVDTRARNAAVAYTHAFSPTAMNEVRVGWLRVSGGQQNANAGVEFADAVGLRGVTTDPRDRGFPQVSTRGVYNTLGDPASTVTRDNQHVELYESLLLDRGRHRVKLGGYLFHLQFRPEQPDNVRGTFTYSGQFTGHPFGDFLLGYPASAVGGAGRGDQDGRTTWVHAFVQDDWRMRDNLTVNVGLRYEYNQHMRDENNRLSSLDLEGSPRFVIASDASGRLHPDATSMVPLLPLPYVSSAAAGWDRGLLRGSPVRLAPRTGFAWSLRDGKAVVRGGYGIFLNQWAYSVQTAFSRNLPFFDARQVDVPATQTVPVYDTRTILTAQGTGLVSPSIMDHAYAVEYTQTWSGGLQYELAHSTMLEASYMGSWTLGADNATVRNVPEPGPGSIQARRPIPALGPIRSIRFDGKSIYHALTLKAQQRLRGNHSYLVSYTVSRSIDDASSPGATEAEANVPQDVRDIFSRGGEWARSSFDHRHVVSASATYALPSSGRASSLPAALLDDWRLTAVVLAQSGAPFTVNLGVDRANIGAGPAQRPDQLRDPNLPGGQRRADQWFDTDAFALPALYAFGSAPRNSVVGPGYLSVDFALGKTWSLGGSRRLELRWEIFNALNRANLDLPNRIFGNPSFGRVSSAKAPRQMQLGTRLSF